MSKGPNRASFYLRKCGEHLRRTIGAYDLGLRGLEATPDLDASAQPSAEKMREVLVRSHFLLLKVNFELFLQLLATEAWAVALRGHRAGKPLSPAAQRRLRGVSVPALSALEHADTIEAIAATVVPAFGLEKLREVLDEVGVDVRAAWNDRSAEIWSQINTAFAVRHVIEHRNGRVDGKFRQDVATTWASSSWGRRSGVVLEAREKVDVVAQDLTETYERMLEALDALQQHARHLDALGSY